MRDDADRKVPTAATGSLIGAEVAGRRSTRVRLRRWAGTASGRPAGELGAERVSAVAAASPARWREYADTAPGAYDEADFAASTVLGRQHRLDGIAIRIDCGESDPFHAVTTEYVAGFATPPAGGFEPGLHDLGYWRRVAAAQLRHLAGAR